MATEKSVEQRIIDYLVEKSRGKLKLRLEHAVHIKNIVLGQDGSLLGSCTAKKFRYSYLKAGWELFRTIPTTPELINERILEAIKKAPVDQSYKYELYNAAGELQGNIWTVDANLFD